MEHSVNWVSVSEAERKYFRDRARRVLGDLEIEPMGQQRLRLTSGGERVGSVQYAITTGGFDLVRIRGDVSPEAALAAIKHENPKKTVRDRREECRPRPGAHDGTYVPGYHADPVQA